MGTHIEPDHQLALFGLQSLYDSVARAAIGCNGVDGVIAVADAYRERAKQRPDLYSAALRAAQLDDPEMKRIFAEFVDVMRAVLAPFILGEEARNNATRGLRSLIHGFVSLELAESFGPPQSIDQSIDESFRFIIRSFVNGLRRVDSKPKR